MTNEPLKPGDTAAIRRVIINRRINLGLWCTYAIFVGWMTWYLLDKGVLPSVAWGLGIYFWVQAVLMIWCDRGGFCKLPSSNSPDQPVTGGQPIEPHRP